VHFRSCGGSLAPKSWTCTKAIYLLFGMNADERSRKAERKLEADLSSLSRVGILRADSARHYGTTEKKSRIGHCAGHCSVDRLAGARRNVPPSCPADAPQPRRHHVWGDQVCVTFSPDGDLSLSLRKLEHPPSTTVTIRSSFVAHPRDMSGNLSGTMGRWKVGAISVGSNLNRRNASSSWSSLVSASAATLASRPSLKSLH
jgi:hypothetical protein